MSTPAKSPQQVRFGAFEADLRTGELRKSGIRIRLQDQPFQVLAMLLERPGELITREEIQQRLWPGDTFVDFDHGLNTAVRRLRDALNDSADSPRWIETLPRRGYRFVGPVEASEAASSSTEGEAAAGELPRPSQQQAWTGPPATETAGDTPALHPSFQSRRRVALLAAIAAIVVIAALLAWRFWPQPTRELSIAVLPFTNETNDPQLTFLVDGISDTLTDNLSELPTLRVLSRNSAQQFRNMQIKASDAGRRLGVERLVMGSVHAEAQTFRVSVELIDTATDRHLWGGQYNFTRTQLATFQPLLAQELSTTLRARMESDVRARLGTQHTSNPAAYEAFLRGRFALRTRNRESLLRAISFFQQAIDLDPNYALAYAGLGDSYGISAYHSVFDPRTALPLGDAALQHALQLAPDLPQVHVSAAYQAMNWRRDLTDAEHEARRAVELAPNLSEAHHALAEVLQRQGKLEDSLAERRIVLTLDPEWPVAHAALQLALISRHRFDEAEQHARRFPGRYSQAGLAVLYTAMGRYGEAAKLYEQLGPPLITGLDASFYAAAFAGVGNREPGQKILDQLLQMRSTGYVSANRIGAIYAALGDNERAYEWMTRAVDEYDPAVCFLESDPLLTVSPLLQSFHNDPRFKQLTERLKQPVKH